jgi:hypothetical protein
MSLLPSFARYPAEGKIVGELVVGYGELEFALARCLGATLESNESAFKALYRARGEEHRILVADALMRDAFAKTTHLNAYCEAIGDIGFCKTVRNQYAHCHWFAGDQGLRFVELENGAKKNTTMTVTYKPVTLALLEEQQLYFQFVNLCLLFLCHEMRINRGATDANPISLPKKLNRPALHEAVSA